MVDRYGKNCCAPAAMTPTGSSTNEGRAKTSAKPESARMLVEMSGAILRDQLAVSDSLVSRALNQS